LKEKDILNFYVCVVNDLGCVLAKRKISRQLYGSKFKLQTFSLVQMGFHRMIVYQCYSNNEFFSYSGCVGNKPSSTFSPVDMYTDSENNFLVVDSYDNTVHLLDPKGKLLDIIMLAEELTVLLWMSLIGCGWDVKTVLFILQIISISKQRRERKGA
jgi:hypothetical protein